MFVADEWIAVNKIVSIKNVNELIEKSGKLLKTRKLLKSLKFFKLKNLKDNKLSKSQKSAKLRKKMSKYGNVPNFNTKKNESSFITPKARAVFNHLWLAFIKALIL